MIKTFKDLQKGQKVFRITELEQCIEYSGYSVEVDRQEGITTSEGWGEDEKRTYQKFDNPLVWVDEINIHKDDLGKSKVSYERALPTIFSSKSATMLKS